MKHKTLSQVYAEASKKNKPLIVQQGHITSLPWVKPPRPQASFGFVNDWVNVAEINGGFAELFIPFQPNRLGWVKQETLHLFRFDPKKKSFALVDDALHHPKFPVIYATIDRPGIYGLIGLHTHPLVQKTIRLLCEFQPIARVLPENKRKILRNKICDLILCSRDMEKLSKSRKELVELMKNLGQDVSGLPLPSKLPVLAPSGETICDRCRGVGIVDLPECHILKDPFHNAPCKQTDWENVGPKHISGAMRQIIVDPTDRRRLYAVSANGGIWRLDNVDNYPTEVWQPLTDRDEVNNLRFRVMAVAPSDGRILYAANSVKELNVDSTQVYSEIYRSSNRGLTWRTIHPIGIGVVHRIVVHPANPNVAFAATSTGLWRQNGTVGAWINLFSDDCLDVVLDPDDSSIVYFGVRNRGLFKSFISGSDLRAGPILAFDPIAAGPDNPATRTDESRQVIKIALGHRNRDGRTEQTRTTRTVVVRFGNEICINERSGESDVSAWRRIVPFISNPTNPNTNDAIASLGGGGQNRSDTDPLRSNEWCNCLDIDPFNSDHILIGSVGLLESRDGGQTWSLRTSPHEDNHSIAFDQEKPKLVYLANDGGIFSSIDGGTTWPTMSFEHTRRSSRGGLNLARGLITSELRHSVVRNGSCIAAIDHTGFIFSDNFDDRWQFLFRGPDDSKRHGLEQSYVFSCPASQDRYYVIDRQGAITSNANLDKPVQFDLSRTNGFVDAPVFNRLSENQMAFPPIGSYFPEDQIYLRYVPGPFAVRFDGDERLLLFAAVNQPGVGFTIQSLRLARNGTTVIEEKTEATNPNEPFSAITFGPRSSQLAFTITISGDLFERDFSNTEPFKSVGRWNLPANDLFVSRVLAVPGSPLNIYTLSQHSIGKFDYGTKRWATLYTELRPNEMLLSLAAHPTRTHTMFLGTNRGVYLSEDGGSIWQPYRLNMPRVPVTGLSFDQGYLYAATLGRGLWRCRPCPK